MTTKQARILAATATALATIGIASVASAATGGPTVTLSSTASSMTSTSPIPVSVMFSEPVNGFSSGAINVTNGGVSELSGSGADYTFNVEPAMAGTTTVMVSTDAATSASSSLGSVASNMLTFLYDMNPDSGSSSTSTATSTPTTTATSTATTMPTISDIMVNDTDQTDATVTWTTDQPATSQVFYGTNTYYGASTDEDMTLDTSHSQTFYGLQDGSTYHFYVQSTDASGTATSSDMSFITGSGTGVNSGSGTTTTSTSTSPMASSTPLAFTGVTAVQTNATADGAFADGWQWVLHFSVPSNENYLSMKFGDFINSAGSGSGTIPAASNIQFWSPEASNANSSSNAVIESNNDYSGWLDLMATSTPDQDVDVYVNVAVPSGTPTGSYSTTFGAFSNTSASTTTTP